MPKHFYIVFVIVLAFLIYQNEVKGWFTVHIDRYHGIAGQEADLPPVRALLTKLGVYL